MGQTNDEKSEGCLLRQTMAWQKNHPLQDSVQSCLYDPTRLILIKVNTHKQFHHSSGK